MVQYSINCALKIMEYSVPDSERPIAHMHHIAQRMGPFAAVWRYDPVLITSLTPAAWHRENFARLARALAGSTNEVVVSFAHIYRKTRRNLETAAAKHGFQWRDLENEEKRALVEQLAAIAADHAMALTLCTQPDLAGDGIKAASCIDADRLALVADAPIQAQRHGNRPGCECSRSRDIGAYDSCPQGCVYCYAVSDQAVAEARLQAHDPKGEFPVVPKPQAVVSTS